MGNVQRTLQYPLINFLEARKREEEGHFHLNLKEFEFYGACISNAQKFEKDTVTPCFFCGNNVPSTLISIHLRDHARPLWKERKRVPFDELSKQHLLVKYGQRKVEQIHNMFFSAVSDWDRSWYLNTYERGSSIDITDFAKLIEAIPRIKSVIICRPCDLYVSYFQYQKEEIHLLQLTQNHQFQHFIDFDYEFFWNNYSFGF